MLCPVCKSVELVMADRQGIEIDYCPTCRGVWLDRGELDKLIDRAVQSVGAAGPSFSNLGQAPAAAQRHGGHAGFKDSDFGHKDHGHGQQGQYGHRKSFWRELFD